jgi:hypothetical protein
MLVSRTLYQLCLNKLQSIVGPLMQSQFLQNTKAYVHFYYTQEPDDGVSM